MSNYIGSPLHETIQRLYYMYVSFVFGGKYSFELLRHTTLLDSLSRLLNIKQRIAQTEFFTTLGFQNLIFDGIHGWQYCQCRLSYF